MTEPYDAPLIAALDPSIDVISACINMTPNKAYRLAARVRHAALLAKNEQLRIILQNILNAVDRDDSRGRYFLSNAKSLIRAAKAELGGSS